LRDNAEAGANVALASEDAMLWDGTRERAGGSGRAFGPDDHGDDTDGHRR
jgi:hypothetical protein